MDRPLAARVLVIEDDPDLRDVIAQLLTSEGHSVTTAATARDGLRQFDTRAPDLVLLDLLLPDLDGLETCRQIRARSSVPIIILTGLTSEPVVVAGLEAGAIDYVRKPFDSPELAARVRAALRRRALNARAAQPEEVPSDDG